MAIWLDSTHRWRNKLIRWLNKLTKWHRGNSLSSPTKCPISQCKWGRPIPKPVSLFRWEAIPKLASPNQAIHKWDSPKWVVTRKLRSLCLRCSQDQVNLNSFPTSRLRDSPFSSSLTNLPQANTSSLRRHLLHSPKEQPAAAKTSRRHRRSRVSSQSEAVRSKECPNQEAADRKCRCRQSPEGEASFRMWINSQTPFMIFIVI